MLVAFSIIAVLAFVAERLWPARPQALFRPGLFTDGVYLVINILLRIAITNTLAISVSRVGQQLLPKETSPGSSPTRFGRSSPSPLRPVPPWRKTPEGPSRLAPGGGTG